MDDLGTTSPLGWLKLNDGHAVPIYGLAPDDIKRSRRLTDERPGHDLGHVQGLNATLHCLGFEGDLGSYRRDGYPRLRAFLEAHGMHRPTDLFTASGIDLFFYAKRFRRPLADRLFFGPKPLPRRAFLGVGCDLASWDQLYYSEETTAHFSRVDPGYVPRDRDEAKRWVYERRMRLVGGGCYNFLGDQLLDPRERGDVDKLYHTGPETEHYREQLADELNVLRVFRWWFDGAPEGWVDVVPYNDNLMFLRGRDGAYDFVWREMREEPPPRGERVEGLLPCDTPRRALATLDFATWNYYRSGQWGEHEAHEAEKHHYAVGGAAGPAYPGSDDVLERYLRKEGVYGDKPPRRLAAATVPGFKPMRTEAGRTLLVSDLVTIGEMKAMMVETGYAARRVGHPWEYANDRDDDALPVAATLHDAHAFCAWMERRLNVDVRLPMPDEYRAWRPVNVTEDSRFVPELPQCVEWEEPGYAVRNGVPVRCRFREALPWAVTAAGLRVLDADDFMEWTDKGVWLGAWYMNFGVFDTWGAHKRVKFGFRLVVELDDSIETQEPLDLPASSRA